LAWVPLANLLAPAFAGLASVHYCLSALERRRGITREMQGRAATGVDMLRLPEPSRPAS
jgi:glutamate synthase domain-containing protein 2